MMMSAFFAYEPSLAFQDTFFPSFVALSTIMRSYMLVWRIRYCKREPVHCSTFDLELAAIACTRLLGFLCDQITHQTLILFSDIAKTLAMRMRP
jgi:hypothetical protein